LRSFAFNLILLWLGDNYGKCVSLSA